MVNLYIDEHKCLRIPEHLRNKIKRAAVANNMTMIAYLDYTIPDIEMKEVPKCQNK
jgi:hypothetical protein